MASSELDQQMCKYVSEQMGELIARVGEEILRLTEDDAIRQDLYSKFKQIMIALAITDLGIAVRQFDGWESWLRKCVALSIENSIPIIRDIDEKPQD
jgi:hypothetical protein